MSNPKVGLVLSSGGPRGAAHAGVLKELSKNGIPIDVIVGTSMGAMVGGIYAAGFSAEEVEEEWLGTDLLRVAKGFSPTFPRHGYSSGRGMENILDDLVGTSRIEELSVEYAALATDLLEGRPIIIKEGSLAEAIRASASIPGVFVPVQRDGQVLADGALVDPLPISIAYELGAEVVIAVDVLRHPGEVEEGSKPGTSEWAVESMEGYLEKWVPTQWTQPLKDLNKGGPEDAPPGIVNTLALSAAIFQRRIVELEKKLSPPEVLIRPEFEKKPRYHDAKEGIQAGERATREAMERITQAIGGVGGFTQRAEAN